MLFSRWPAFSEDFVRGPPDTSAGRQGTSVSGCGAAAGKSGIQRLRGGRTRLSGWVPIGAQPDRVSSLPTGWWTRPGRFLTAFRCSPISACCSCRYRQWRMASCFVLQFAASAVRMAPPPLVDAALRAVGGDHRRVIATFTLDAVRGVGDVDLVPAIVAGCGQVEVGPARGLNGQLAVVPVRGPAVTRARRQVDLPCEVGCSRQQGACGLRCLGAGARRSWTAAIAGEPAISRPPAAAMTVSHILAVRTSAFLPARCLYWWYTPRKNRNTRAHHNQQNINLLVHQGHSWYGSHYRGISLPG